MLRFLNVKIENNPQDNRSMLIAEEAGCGCCGGPMEIDQAQLEVIISDLSRELKNAEALLLQWQADHPKPMEVR